MTAQIVEPRKILFVSVGGSADPIITCIKKVIPDEIVFVVSNGSNGQTSSRDTLAEIRKQTGHNNPEKIIEVEPDDLGNILSQVEPELSRALALGCQVHVDYTGGTKTMTSALVLAASMYDEINLQFMAGQRKDLSQVVSGTENPTEMHRALLGFAQGFATARAFTNKRNYGAALGVLKQLSIDLEKFKKAKVKAPKAWRMRLDQWVRWLTIIDLWDRFDHRLAFEKLEYGLDNGEKQAEAFEVANLHLRLGALCKSKVPTPELLEDLWLNALRRADLQLYDDAMSRLYRLSEATVQAYLWKLGVDTSNVDLEVLQPSIRRDLEGRGYHQTFQISLSQAKRQLKYMQPECKLFELWSDENPAWQGQRNNSILAHGFNPITKRDFDNAKKWFQKSLYPCWEDLLGRPLVDQLPNELPQI